MENYAQSSCYNIFLFVTQNMCILLYLSLFKLLIQFVLYSLSKDRNAGLFLFHCKEMTNSKGQCRLTQFKGKLDKVQLIRFLQSQTLPKYVSISRVAGAEYKKKIDNSLVCQTRHAY